MNTSAMSSTALPECDGTDFYNRLMHNGGSLLGQCINKKPYQPIQRRGDGDIASGHVGRYISLANPDRMSSFACHIPAIFLYTFLGIFVLAYLHSQESFFSCTMLLFGYIICWATYMSSLSLIGIMKMRASSHRDWNRELADYIALGKQQTSVDEMSGVLHFVCFPNYAEDEEMLSQSIVVCSQNEMAKERMVIVLAMEAREGDLGERKANRLIERHSHLFHSMFATYHPASIPGEVKGKSSNTQWAFRDIQRFYGSYVSQNPDEAHDTSKVFISIVDADSIFQKDYFASLTLTALGHSQEDRAWLIYQPPILTLRNIDTAIAPVRCAGYGSFLFECSGLTSSAVFDHLCFSTYTIPLALANHPIVDGWDADVIAEDHHMFLKCMFASYWEEIFSEETNRSVTRPSKLKIQPVWCPVTSYLVQEESWWGSVKARYCQAIRHMQGVAELSYICLQHATIAQSGREQMPLKAHLQLFHLVLKYSTITIINSAYSIVLALCVVIGCVYAIQRFFDPSTSPVEKLQTAASEFEGERESNILFNSLVTAIQFGMPLFCTLAVVAQWAAVKDTLEGKYCPVYLQLEGERVNEDGTTSGSGMPSCLNTYGEIRYENEQYVTLCKDAHGSQFELESSTTPSFASTLGSSESAVTSTTDPSRLSASKLAAKNSERVLKSRKMTFASQIRLLLCIYTDLNLIGQLSLLMFGSIPVLKQCIYLSRWGHKFDYTVAAKPQLGGKKQDDVASVSTKIGSASFGSQSATGSEVDEPLEQVV